MLRNAASPLAAADRRARGRVHEDEHIGHRVPPQSGTLTARESSPDEIDAVARAADLRMRESRAADAQYDAQPLPNPATKSSAVPRAVVPQHAPRASGETWAWCPPCTARVIRCLGPLQGAVFIELVSHVNWPMRGGPDVVRGCHISDDAIARRLDAPRPSVSRARRVIEGYGLFRDATLEETARYFRECHARTQSKRGPGRPVGVTIMTNSAYWRLPSVALPGPDEP